MKKEAGQLFHELKEDITDYVEVKFELFKLNAYERVGKVVGLLSYGLVLMFITFFALLFVFFSVGFFLGELFHSMGLGFACIAFFYLLIMLVVILNKGKIQTKVVNEVVEALITVDEKNEKNNGEKTDTPGETTIE